MGDKCKAKEVMKKAGVPVIPGSEEPVKSNEEAIEYARRLARAEGIPAREVFGIRMPKGKEGEITKSQHCWAEFYSPGYGWVVVDPADVRKAILEKKITLQEAQPLREYYFGAVDENRVAFGTGRDLRLNPPQQGKPLNYFMYPYAEADGKPLNEDLYGFNLGYTIAFREL